MITNVVVLKGNIFWDFIMDTYIDESDMKGIIFRCEYLPKSNWINLEKDFYIIL
jgi:hypothetical protein